MNYRLPSKGISLNVPERVLYFSSRNPDDGSYIEGQGVENTLNDVLDIMNRIHYEFLDGFQGKEILDFSCGHGYQVVALAIKGAKHTAGIDMREKLLETRKRHAVEAWVADKAIFYCAKE
jgi:2-polyprenyl-3-methyl-5-hydroxy-6-metoxy-1,4-benzoquinol methylase